jgi:hypothetical protein
VKLAPRLETVEVMPDREGPVSHAAAVLLVELADGVGRSGGLSGALAGTGAALCARSGPGVARHGGDAR